MAIRKGASKPPIAKEAKGAALPGPRTPKQTPTISGDGSTLTVHIPISLYRTPGRKIVIAPARSNWAPKLARPDNTLVKALGRAFRWRKLLEAGQGTLSDLARAEDINPSYLCRILRLTLLSPEIIEQLLETNNTAIGIQKLLKPFPDQWIAQRARLKI